MDKVNRYQVSSPFIFQQQTIPKETLRQHIGTIFAGESYETLPDTLGIPLNASRHKAINALEKIFDKTGYQGTEKTTQAFKEENPYGYEGPLPKFRMTYLEYYEAYGAEWANERVEAFKALDKLAGERFCLPLRKVNADKSVTYEILTDHLLKIDYARTLSEEEDMAFLAGGLDPRKIKRKIEIIITPSPLWLRGILDKPKCYALIPNDLEDQVKVAYGKQAIPVAIRLFMSLLHAQAGLETWTYTVNQGKLINRLQLGKRLKARHLGAALESVNECFSLALKMGFINSYHLAKSKRGKHQYVIKLNPSKFAERSKKGGKTVPNSAH
jgi:hypothetical protein